MLWNSRRYDFDTELCYYKYRHYKADYGRWLGRDPIEEDGGLNVYSFVENSSLDNWDILGLQRITTILKKKSRDFERSDKFTVQNALEQLKKMKSDVMLKSALDCLLGVYSKQTI